jgi:mono/diheme cytochrome c family protein
LVPGIAAATDVPPHVAPAEAWRVEAPVARATWVGELACVACHASTQPVFAPKPGPDLSRVGARVHPDHLRQYIAHPARVKPGTTMPDILHALPDAERAQVAEDLAAYLSSLGGPLAAGTQPTEDTVERGRALYHQVGCVACHDPEGEALPGSVPLGPVAEKYTLASLTAFLEDPLAARPGGRMPSSHLQPFEAEEIAAFLLRGAEVRPAVAAPDTARVARGRERFVQHRCTACHATGDPALPAAVAARSWRELRPDHGCLAEAPTAGVHYPLSPAQRTQLRAALGEETLAWSTTGRVQVAVTRLQCLACHDRDGRGGVPAERAKFFTGREESLGDQGRLPPTLTGVGGKLQAPWLREVLASGAGVRPYLHTRMPKYGEANTAELAAWLKQTDPPPTATFDRVPAADKPHQIGRDLAGSKGLNCIACHTFRGRAAAIPGLELTTLAERLEESWFHRFLEQPQRFVPLTVMPGFWPDGQSPLPAVLGGDPGRQRDALWQYFARGPEAPEPAGLALEPLILEVKEEAVLVRRAFPGIGKRGIGVGYPGGIHLAFDAEQMRLASVWTGGFLEASGIWRGQGSGQLRPLGKNATALPTGPAFAVLASPDAPWPDGLPPSGRSAGHFGGYTLDAQRRPRFRYDPGGFSVEDVFHERRNAAGALFLERRLEFPGGVPAGLLFRVAAGKDLTLREGPSLAVGPSLLIRLPAAPQLRPAGEGQEAILSVSGPLTLEYHPVASP